MDRASVGTTMLPQGGPDMHILAPAGPLSRVIVYAVGSTQFGGWGTALILITPPRWLQVTAASTRRGAYPATGG